MLLSGETLRVLRQIKGVKQQIIANQLGISQPAYSNIETSHFVDCKRFEKILSILGYSKKDFKEIIENHLPTK